MSPTTGTAASVQQRAAGTFASAIDLDVLRYSRVWEDHALLDEGLAVNGDSRILSIASAGCNVLALLMSEPRSVTAVDVSPVQMALVELQLGAIRHLSAGDARRLLGVEPASPRDRVRLFGRVRPSLSSAARSIWDGRIDRVAGGIAFAGRLEQYVLGFTRNVLTRYVPDDALHRLFTLASAGERHRWVEDHLSDPGLAAAFRAWFGREKMGSDGRDPAQLQWVDETDVGTVFWDRFRWACAAQSRPDNFYLHAFLFGAYGEAVPPHLTDAGHARLQPLLDRVSLHVGDLAGCVTAVAPGTFSHANLSDVFEYMSEEEAARTMGIVADVVEPGGRVAYWNLLVPRPPSLSRNALVRLDELSDELLRHDRSWFYRWFHVAEVLR